MMAIKWGVVGAGKISNDFVAAVKSLKNNKHEFVAVAARDLTSAEKFATIHGISKAYGSYEEIANDSDVDVVYIGNINTQHFALGKLMLEHGKHVLMEKPMTLNSKQTRTLCEIAEKHKRFLMEALWSRFLPSYSFLMKLISEGAIGDIVHVGANLGFPMIFHSKTFKKELGGGSILDLGIYPLNIVSMVYGMEKPLELKAIGHLNDDGVDISVTCSLLYSDNRTAVVTTSATANMSCDAVITGTKGSIQISPVYCGLQIECNGKTHSFPIPESESPTNYPNSNGLKYEAEAVRKCIENGELQSSVMPWKDSKILAEIMDEIRKQLGVVYADD